MIMMKKVNGISSIDYTKTSWMEESFRMAEKKVDRKTFDRFKQAVISQNDRVIMEILADNCVSIKYFF